MLRFAMRIRREHTKDKDERLVLNPKFPHSLGKRTNPT